MDALALLCTLHADGPATLVRLRAAGCTMIDAVGELDTDALSVLLRASKRAAVRFQNESRLLGERLAAEVVPTPANTEPAPRARRVEPPAASSGSARAKSLDQVLAAWREQDALEAPPPPSKSAALARPAADALPVAAVDGLNAETALALARAGIRTLPALAACDPLAISRLTKISYSKLVRLRALARRAGQGGSESAERVPAERFSPSEWPRTGAEPVLQPDRDFVLEPHASEESVGGPFA